MKDRKKRIKILMIICNVIVCILSIVCMIQTCKNNKRLNQAKVGTKYCESGCKVALSLMNGEEVYLTFGAEAVTVIDAYRYEDYKIEILLFVKEYGTRHGYEFKRQNSELLGEYSLHTILYKAGYKREQTGDLDWDYGEDKRWYVNVIGRIIGWMGI